MFYSKKLTCSKILDASSLVAALVVNVVLGPHVRVPVAAASVGIATGDTLIGGVVAVVGLFVEQEVDKSLIALADTTASR